MGKAWSIAAIELQLTRLNAIGAPLVKRVRFGAVDSMVGDPNNPLITVLRNLRQHDPSLRVDIGIFDYLACLEELRANRLDIAIVGIAGDERIPSEAEAIPLYREASNLYCSPDHACAQVKDAETMKVVLAQSDISTHSFVFNPIDKGLDPKLLDHSDGIAQDTIELTAYLALSGSHVGLLPDHFAAAWVTAGALVSLSPLTPTIHSDFHAIRLRPDRPTGPLEFAWQALKSRA
jgi:DNA-binding transcriptional LysR family regulator